MSEAFNREFLKFDVSETTKGLGYWLDRPWVDETQRAGLLSASIVAVPAEGDDDAGPTFPEGSGAFIARMREVLADQVTLGVAIRHADYQELALHSKAWRLPTLLIAEAVLGLVVGLLTNRIEELLPGAKAGDTAEITLIVDGPQDKALKLHYKGDPQHMGRTLEDAIPRFIDQLDAALAATSPPPASKTEVTAK